MDLEIPILATVITEHTGEFEAPLSHVTTSTAFIETMHGASFGDTLELRFSDLLMKAEVAFVSDAPMGWVIRFESSRALVDRARAGPSAALDALSGAEDGAAPVIEDPLPFPGPELWGEPTPTFDGPPITAV